MELEAAQEKFIQTWSQMGTSWGINKTMAQIHALLLIAPEELSAEDMMEQLQVSRGNVNMNVRALLDWGLVYKKHKAGQRMEFFYAEKDIAKLARAIARERRKREIEPVVTLMAELSNADLGTSDAAQSFSKVTADIHRFSNKVDRLVDQFSRSDENWFYNKLLRLFK